MTGEWRPYWILDAERNPVPARDVFEWARCFERPDRIVAKTEIGHVRISTVFLGIDHGFPGVHKEPILFETMIFGGKHDGWQQRCATWAQAEAMHAKAVALVRREPLPRLAQAWNAAIEKLHKALGRAGTE